MCADIEKIVSCSNIMFMKTKTFHDQDVIIVFNRFYISRYLAVGI